MDLQIEKKTFLGRYPVHSLTMEEALRWIDNRIHRRQGLSRISVINANKVFLMDRNQKLFEAILTSDLVIPEQAVIIGAAMCGIKLKERVSGIELVENLINRHRENKTKLFLLGAKKEVVERLKDIINSTSNGASVVGYNDGYFKTDSEVIEKINRSGAEVLLVAMGSPRQELWIYENRERLRIPVAVGVGGTFDVLAGEKKRAPEWTRIGLEWLYRLAQEPKRLWKRYTITNSYFMYRVFRYIIFGR